MIKVKAEVGDNYMTMHFPSLKDAINYVSFEYEYYSKLYIETEKYNAADTKDCVVCFDDEFYDEFNDEDHHCELYSNELRMAYIDSWDMYMEWQIEEK